MSRNMHRGRAPKSMGKTALRVIKMLRGFYPVMLPAVAVCILIQCIVQAMPNVFMERALTVVGETWESGDWAAAQPQVFTNAAILAVLYFASLICNAVWQQCMAILTQGSLKKFRCLMFDHMQDLPIKYFDTHPHGDIMSYYTNDIDAMRQMIAQSMPQLFLTMLMLISVGCIMIWYSLPLTLVVVGGAAIMAFLGKTLAGRSAKNFLRTQRAVAAVEGLVEEVMNGEKVIKVFSHERQIERAFDELNDEYQDAACTANSYANTLMPILMNSGNLLYVIVAVMIGIFLVLYVIVAVAIGVLLVVGAPNPSLSGLPLTIAVGVPFLNMTKQFANQIGQISNQVNSVVMGLAGAERIFELLDEPVEQDEGYVELVACTIDGNGTVRECSRRDENWAGQWAWKHPHHVDGTVTYTPLAGDVRLFGVDFAYEPGKTTITNLLNRFYDIEDGKIRYDGININKIKKPHLRRSLGMVLQDVNLFTGTVMDNIRYGRLDATDEECIAAARLAGADDFVRRLPDGYQTMLTDNGTNLSQGQRQLLSIARAAVADPPVMVLDEATSSIDTRTEAIVQRGMDALMAGRTTFVIAHRLSTVRNSDVIIVLDHGRIIERGTHDELIAARGTYYQLYTGAFELE